VTHLQTATQRGSVGLLMAHPGHEAALHGWLQKNRPTVFVLTDGSDELTGATLAATTHALERLRVRTGSVYGRFTGTAVARAILRKDVTAFAPVVHELVEWLSEQPVRYLVTDAAEGHDPAHDLCRTIAGVAVELTAVLSGRSIPLYEYVVSGDRGPCLRGECPDSTRWPLGAGRVECLHHVAPRAEWRCPRGEAPAYERRESPAAGPASYASLIRYREHMLPLASELWSMVAVARAREARLTPSCAGRASHAGRYP
jgi:hypothetical protein